MQLMPMLIDEVEELFNQKMIKKYIKHLIKYVFFIFYVIWPNFFFSDKISKIILCIFFFYYEFKNKLCDQ